MYVRRMIYTKENFDITSYVSYYQLNLSLAISHIKYMLQWINDCYLHDYKQYYYATLLLGNTSRVLGGYALNNHKIKHITLDS